MNKIMIADRSYWVGKVDDRPVPFHRLILEKGTNYNCYLLDTEKPTLIDTVDIAFGVEFVKNLEQIMDLNKLQYVVINHVEPDHAGGLPALMNKAKNATIVTTAKARELLNGMFKLHNRNYLVINDGDTLDIGGKTLKFFETPYLHTEETMVTYAVEDKILYPCDQFSTHIATYDLFNDLAKEDITEDFKVYYSLIMGPHRPFVRKMLDKIKNLEIKMIAPSHGFILRENVQKYMDLYDTMSQSASKSSIKRALILFSSMTGNTAKIAQNLSNGLEEFGVETTVINIKNADIEDIKILAQETDAILIGSSTRYGDMIGNIEDSVKEIVKLDLSDKLGAAFGSYGWSGESIEIINDYLKLSNIKLVDTSYLIKSTGDGSIQFPLRVNFYGNDERAELSMNAGRLIGDLLVSQGA
jgi:flavorubredoxin